MEIVEFKGTRKLSGDLRWLVTKDDEDNNLATFIKAVLRVGTPYIYSPSQNETRLERVFAYELYHLWSTQIEKCNKTTDNNNHKYILNGEIGKNLSRFINPADNTIRYPDLVLHKSIDNPDNQGIVCEIKRDENCKKGGLQRDLDKLISFVCGPQNEYKFRFGVFLLVGNTISKILYTLNEIGWTKRKRSKLEGTERIFLAAYNASLFQIVSLYDALDKKEREQYLRLQ